MSGHHAQLVFLFASEVQKQALVVMQASRNRATWWYGWKFLYFEIRKESGYLAL
jgi:hypothetical protein